MAKILNINDSLNEKFYDGETIHEAVEIIMESMPLGILRDNWASTSEMEKWEFYSQLPHFRRKYKEQLAEAQSAFDSMNIENYLSVLNEMRDVDYSDED